MRWRRHWVRKCECNFKRATVTSRVLTRVLNGGQCGVEAYNCFAWSHMKRTSKNAAVNAIWWCNRFSTRIQSQNRKCISRYPIWFDAKCEIHTQQWIIIMIMCLHGLSPLTIYNFTFWGNIFRYELKLQEWIKIIRFWFLVGFYAVHSYNRTWRYTIPYVFIYAFIRTYFGT